MAKVAWNQLPERLKIVLWENASFERPTTIEVDAALDAYEKRFGFEFPMSYRQFVHWFGPGSLSSWYKVCAPIPIRFRERLVAACFDMDQEREMLEDPEGYWAESVSPEKLKRFILFATTEGGDWFFWDTADVRDRAEHEYGIYYHSHDNSRGKVELIATDFTKFVTELALGEKYPSGQLRDAIEMTYRPGLQGI